MILIPEVLGITDSRRRDIDVPREWIEMIRTGYYCYFLLVPPRPLHYSLKSAEVTYITLHD